MTASTYSISLAFLAFFSTTLDDFAVVLIFFGKEYVKTHDIYDLATRNAFISIIVGQILGFTMVVAISLGVGIGLRYTVEDSYIDLIGFLPILIGLYKVYQILDEDGYLISAYRSLCCVKLKTVEEEIDSSAPQLKGETVPLLDKTDNSSKKDVETTELKKADNSSIKGGKDEKLSESEFQHYQSGSDGGKEEALEGGSTVEEIEEIKLVGKKGYLCNALVEEVALYALLFGVDNIAIYVSLLCTLTNSEILASIVVFYSLLFVYLGIACLIITQVRQLAFLD